MESSALASALLSLLVAGCGANSGSAADSNVAGGASSSAGASAGGALSAGGGTSGVAGAAFLAGAGGVPSTAGASNAGAASGGAPNAGGTNGAGASTGGTSTGGTSTGGAANAGGGGSAGVEVITAPAGYKLVWHDEFDVDGAPDPKNWKFEKGFVRNEELQWYQTDNATVQGGMLVIEARQETVQNPNYTGTGDWKTTRKTASYTSSSLNTSGLQSFQYGHFEMRARIPTDAGMWPAWWTLGVSGQWPSNGEIDIMEYYQNKVLANVACGTSNAYTAKWDSASKALSARRRDLHVTISHLDDGLG